jgi:hypothetical protein
MTPIEFITENWLELTIALMAFIKVIVNLTPTDKDNQIFGLFDKIIDALVPNRKRRA